MSKDKWKGPVDFMTAFDALNGRKSIKCNSGGKDIVYGVSCEELYVDGKPEDYRNFCFAPSQIAHGQWFINDKGKAPEQKEKAD